MRQAARSQWMALILLIALAVPAASQSQAEAPRWRPLGPWGGRASVLVADPFQPGRFLAVGDLSSQLHRSEDGGRRWTWLGRGVNAGTITALVPSPHTPGLVLAVAGGAVWRSRDWGQSWEQTSLGTHGKVLGLTFLPSRPGTVAALKSDGSLYISHDDGDGWRESYQFRPPCGPKVPCMEVSGLLTAAGDGSDGLIIATDGIFRCTVSPPFCAKTVPSLPAQPTALASFPAPAGSWLALGTEALTSTDGGLTWTPASEGLGDISSPLYGPAVIKDLRLDPSTGEVYALTPAGLLRWLADEHRWALLDPRAVSAWEQHRSCGWAVGDGEHLFGCGSAAGPFAWRGTAAALEERSDGFAGRNAVAVLLSPRDGQPGVAVTRDGLFRYHQESESWVRVQTLGHTSTATVVTRPGAPSHWFAATDEGLFESLDEGWTWSRVETPFPLFGDWVRLPLAAVTSAGKSLLAGSAWSNLWWSPDLGRSWTQTPHQVQALWVSPTNPDHVWAIRFRTLFFSRDGGRTWEAENQASQAGEAHAQCPFFPCSWDQVSALAVDPFGGRWVLAATNGGGLKRYTPEAGWTSVSSPLATGRALLPDPHTPGRVVAAGWATSFPAMNTVGRVGVLEMDGVAWFPLGANMGDLPPILEMAVSFPHGRYAVATEGGVFLLEDTPRDNRPLRRSAPARR